MPSRAWSLLPNTSCCVFMRFVWHLAAVYAHFLFNSEVSVKQSFANSLFFPLSAVFVNFSATLLLPVLLPLTLRLSFASCISPARMARAAQLPARRTFHDRYARCNRRSSCRWSGRAIVAAHARPRQARRAVRRRLPHHRHHAFQLHQLRSPPRLRSHAIQSAQP